MKKINKSIKFYLLIDIRYYLSLINKRLFFYISISNWNFIPFIWNWSSSKTS